MTTSQNIGHNRGEGSTPLPLLWGNHYIMQLHVPQVQFLDVACTADNKELQLLVDLLHHPREGEGLWVGGGGQLQVLVREHLQHSMELLVCEDLDRTVVVIVKRLPRGRFDGRTEVKGNVRGLQRVIYQGRIEPPKAARGHATHIDSIALHERY